MTIHEYYYNDDNRRLYVEFSTEEDEDKFYRVLQLGLNEIEYYFPDILEDEDLINLNEDFIIDLINQYILENDLPNEITL